MSDGARSIVLSHSSMKQWETCPQQFYREKIARNVERSTNYKARLGDIIHRDIERVLLGKRSTTFKYKGFRGLRDVVEKAKAMEGEIGIEEGIAITSDWKTAPIDKRVGSKSYPANAVVVGYADMTVRSPQGEGVVIDWKTGQPRYVDLGQLSLMSLMQLMKHPDMPYVEGRFVFPSNGKEIKATYHRENVPLMQENLYNQISKVQREIESGNFPPKPNPFCKTCKVLDCPYRPAEVKL